MPTSTAPRLPPPASTKAFYECGAQRISMFAMASNGASPGGCIEGLNGFAVCRRVARGVEYDMDDARVRDDGALR